MEGTNEVNFQHSILLSMYHAMACLTVPKLLYLGEHSGSQPSAVVARVLNKNAV